MHEEWTARRTSGTDSISCKYKINIVFVARVSRDNHAEIISRHVIICFCIFGPIFYFSFILVIHLIINFVSMI